ncbi:receptor-like protein kinase isoform X2 [Nymphaea colorata]|uniref:receptor-like protein kinase isoform X2 n=1 Tax=Nymphaea colorata TaxID=210225 RepID=UPI00129DD9C7|nr:receptor-like protein kinase isoform X2 [Nymphaea colorata]
MKGEHGIAIRATIVILVVAVSSFRLASCLSRDGLVLLSLSKGWVLPEQVSGTWNVSDATPCMWRGVLCNRLHRVVSINMSQVGVSGKLVSEIGLLAHLQKVDLAGNNLSGEIPATLGNCTELVYLDLSMNFLSGPIPESFGRLKRLSSLSLYGNFLNNGLPRTLFQLPLLETLYLNQNNFSGIIPDSMGNLTTLRIAWLSDNCLFGVLPESIGNCTQLTELYLFNNQLVGSLPPTLNRISGLGYVDVHRNRFSGRVQIGDGGCGSLNVLILSFNSFSGQIPMQLGNCSELVALAMVDNSLSGSIPASFGSLTKLSQLYLSKNQLSGSIPPEIGNCASLTDLQINENQLRGRIPSQIGGIPEFLSAFGRLLELQLGGNMLGGDIPPSLGEIQSLDIGLNISCNGLVGQIPLQLGQLYKLQSLDISLNNLTGNLSPLVGLQSILQVNVSHNHFVGAIPHSWVKFLNISPTSFLGNSGLCIPCLQDDIICDDGILARCKATKSDHRTTRVMVVAIVLGAIFLSVLLLTVVKLLPLSHPHSNVAELQLQEGPSSMLNRVMEATGNLNQQYIIGRGAHGTIYKVEHGLGKPYVVKKIDFKGRKGPNKSMMKEIQTLGSIKHRNLLKLENFWFRDSHGLILYDFMENGSLHDVLHEVRPPPLLEWNVRYRIALGIAQGLAYLHHDCNPAIIHRDIKPKNVLLDSEMEPHISDFGIAKLMKLSSTGPPSSSVVGTPGYMAPEMAFSTLKSKESDVYSYGVLLLELLTRKKALDPSFGEEMDIVGWVNATLISSNKVIDPCLTAEFLDSSIKEEVSKVLLIAMRCTAKDPSGRPTMRGVVKRVLDIKATKLE